LKELKSIQISFLILDSLEFSQILAYFIANAEFTLWCNYFIILLIFQLLLTKRIITRDLSAFLLVSFDLWQAINIRAVLAFDSEWINDFLYDTRSTPYSNIFVAHWTIFIKY
jgi:hypothetical protein